MTTPMNMPETPAPWVDDFDLGPVAGDETPQRHRRWRWLVVPVVVVLIAGAVLWVVKPLGTTATSLVTATATTGTIVSDVNLSGSVTASTVDELSFTSGGTVTAVNVTPGTAVTAGEVLATIDDSSLQAQIATAQANLIAAQVRLAADKAGPTKHGQGRRPQLGQPGQPPALDGPAGAERHERQERPVDLAGERGSGVGKGHPGRRQGGRPGRLRYGRQGPGRGELSPRPPSPPRGSRRPWPPTRRRPR